MKNPIIFTDLDDTLFQTMRKIPEGTPDLTVMSTLVDGSPSGYATPRQQAFLEWLQSGNVIPVTARSQDVINRVNITYDTAIVANGGAILTNGGKSIDEDWHHRLRQKAAETPIKIAVNLIKPMLGPDVRSWPVVQADIELYYCIKSNTDDMARLEDIKETIAPLLGDGWRVHLNGNNLAFLPPWLNKRNAVQYLMDNFDGDESMRPIVGFGDSKSDTGFMDLCDYALTPTNSQIWTAFKENNEWCR